MRAAIFDVDGTLLDSVSAWENVGSDYVKNQGLIPAEDLDKRVKECCLRDVAVIMQNEYGIDKSLEDIETEISKMVEYKYFNTLPLKDGVLPLLEGLKERGVKMCLASASRYSHIEAALSRCGVMHYFSRIFSCIDVGYSKREREIYELAMEHLGSEPENTYMFDDALYVAQTAGAIGINCVGMRDEHMLYQQELKNSTDFYIEDYNDLSGFWAWFDK